MAAGDERQSGAQKIGGVGGWNSLGLALLDAVEVFGETRIAGAQAGDGGVAALDQGEERRIVVLFRRRGGGFGGIAELDEGVWAVLAAFGRVKLSKARAENAGLPIFAAGGDLFLFNAIFDLPDFGAVVVREADDDDLEERLVGRKIEFVMELGDEGTEFFEESHSESFEVGRGCIGELVIVLVGSAGDGLEVAVEADRLGCGGDLPRGGAEDNADMAGVELQEAGRDGTGFDGLVDGGEDDDVVTGDLNDDAAAGEAGDDFVFALDSLRGGRYGEEGCGDEGGEKGEATHGRVQLITVTGVEGSAGGRGSTVKEGFSVES